MPVIHLASVIELAGRKEGEGEEEEEDEGEKEEGEPEEEQEEEEEEEEEVRCVTCPGSVQRSCGWVSSSSAAAATTATAVFLRHLPARSSSYKNPIV